MQQMTGYRRDVATSAEIRQRRRQTPEFLPSALPPRAFWTVDPAELLRRLESSPAGLDQENAARRLERYGTNELHQERDRSPLAILWRQLRSPLLRLFTQAPVASAEDVARYGYHAMMRGKRVAVQGISNKAMVQVERLVPRAIVTRLARKVHETS